ncbi:MAG: hypothetical protein AAGC55_15150, partial [Myxococcota bacterium]
RDVTAGLSDNRTLDIQLAGGRVGYTLARAQPASNIARTVQWVSQHNSARYDTVHGAPHFIEYNYPNFDCVILLLHRYLRARYDPGALCNCYDMAAVLQLYLRMIGISEPAYCFMNPYGYLVSNALVGWGLTNNPFFGGPLSIPQVVPATGELRTGFGNHAFCMIPATKTIADATAGPHLGSESVDYYVATALDPVQPSPPSWQTGTAEDIGYYRGVIATDRILSVRSPRNLSMVKELMTTIDHDRAVHQQPPSRIIITRWPSPLTCPAIAASEWTMAHDEVLTGPAEVNRHWTLIRDRESITIDIHLASRDDCHAVAENRFLHMAAINNRGQPIVSPGPSWLGHSSAVHRGAERSWYAWWFHNAAFRLRCNGPTIDSEAIARWLQDHAARALSPDDGGGESAASLASYRSSIPALSKVPATIAVGEEFTISIDPDSEFHLRVHNRHKGVRCTGSSSQTLHFEAMTAVSGELEFIVFHPETLIAISETFTIDVVPSP